jgi:cysteine synthase
VERTEKQICKNDGYKQQLKRIPCILREFFNLDNAPAYKKEDGKEIAKDDRGEPSAIVGCNGHNHQSTQCGEKE